MRVLFCASVLANQARSYACGRTAAALCNFPSAARQIDTVYRIAQIHTIGPGSICAQRTNRLGCAATRLAERRVASAGVHTYSMWRIAVLSLCPGQVCFAWTTAIYRSTIRLVCRSETAKALHGRVCSAFHTPTNTPYDQLMRRKRSDAQQARQARAGACVRVAHSTRQPTIFFDSPPPRPRNDRCTMKVGFGILTPESV